MKGEDSERGREYWLTCNTESGGGRDPANIKYIITFILISLLAPVCLLARLPVERWIRAWSECEQTASVYSCAFFTVNRDPHFSTRRILTIFEILRNFVAVYVLSLSPFLSFSLTVKTLSVFPHMNVIL